MSFYILFSGLSADEITGVIEEAKSQDYFYDCQRIDRGNCLDFDERALNSLECKNLFTTGWIYAIGKHVNRNMIMICSDLAFRHLRNVEKNLVIFKLNDNEIISSNSIIFGVSGLSTFHQIDEPAVFFWNSLEFITPFELDSTLDMLRTNLTYRRGRLYEEMIDLEDSFDGLVETEISGPTIDEGDLKFDDVISGSIGLKSSDLYASRQCIDYRASSESLKSDFDVQYSQTADIDGIFIMANFRQLPGILKSPISIFKNPSIAFKRDVNCFKNIFGTIFGAIDFFMLSEIGSITLEWGTFNLFLGLGLESADIDDNSSSRMASNNLLSCIKESLQLAMKLYCDMDPEHLESCATKEIRNQRNSSLPISGLKEDLLAAELIPCVFYHLERELNRIVNVHHLKHTFYLRMVGTKNVLTTGNFSELPFLLESVSTSVNFLKLADNNSAVDICFHTVPFVTDDPIMVTFN